MRRALVLATVVLLAVVGTVHATPASACSCFDRGLPPHNTIIEGRAVAKAKDGLLARTVTFDAVKPPLDDHVTVHFTGCTIGHVPLVGGVYQVAAYEMRNGEFGSFLCGHVGGSVTELAAPPFWTRQRIVLAVLMALGGLYAWRRGRTPRRVAAVALLFGVLIYASKTTFGGDRTDYDRRLDRRPAAAS